MSLPNQIAAYEDCSDLFERALADAIGHRRLMSSVKAAHHMRSRMNKFRYLCREESKRMYERTDQRWGKSEYDCLKVTIKDDDNGGWWVFVERHGLKAVDDEPLSEYYKYADEA